LIFSFSVSVTPNSVLIVSSQTAVKVFARSLRYSGGGIAPELELELELTQTQMAQKLMLREEVLMANTPGLGSCPLQSDGSILCRFNDFLLPPNGTRGTARDPAADAHKHHSYIFI
jgi:hypothetical protein